MEVSCVENGCDGTSRLRVPVCSRVKLPTGPDSVGRADGSTEHFAGSDDRHRIDVRIENLFLWSLTVSRTNWVERHTRRLRLMSIAYCNGVYLLVILRYLASKEAAKKFARDHRFQLRKCLM